MISLLWPEGAHRNGESFSLDEAAWKDLEIDRLHQRLSACRLSTPVIRNYLGEMIRSPEVLEWRQSALGFLLDRKEASDRM